MRNELQICVSTGWTSCPTFPSTLLILTLAEVWKISVTPLDGNSPSDQPAMSSDEPAGRQWAQQPSDAEDGHSEGPDERKLPLIQVNVVSLRACEVHKLLDVLRKPSKRLFDAIPKNILGKGSSRILACSHSRGCVHHWHTEPILEGSADTRHKDGGYYCWTLQLWTNKKERKFVCRIFNGNIRKNWIEQFLQSQ